MKYRIWFLLLIIQCACIGAMEPQERPTIQRTKSGIFIRAEEGRSLFEAEELVDDPRALTEDEALKEAAYILSQGFLSSPKLVSLAQFPGVQHMINMHKHWQSRKK